MTQWTTDSFFNGRLTVNQEKTGYRFSLDAVIVAGAVQPKPGQAVLDLGTGCGIIALVLAFRHPSVRVVAIEIQPQLAALAQTNVAQNNLENRVTVVEGDMRQLHARSLGRSMDWVVCNPPYRRTNSGRINPQMQKALARHEINIDLAGLVQSAHRLLRSGGQFVTIYPAQRTVDLLAVMRREGIEPKSLQSIQSRPAEAARLVWVRGAKGGRPGLAIQRPLVIYDHKGEYTEDMARVLLP